MLAHTGLNKLEGFGPIYVINLERSSDRKEYIVEHFSKYGVFDYTFISAIDGSSDDLDALVSNHKDLSISDGELSCGLSHLKAIQHWLDTSESEYAIFIEDDISFETVDSWDFTWLDFYKAVDKKYDVLQLSITNNYTINPRLHLREFLDWSTVCYLIKRPYAEQLVKKYKIEEKYVFSKNRFLSVAEALIYGKSLCYSIPLFTFTDRFDSNINPDHKNTIHANSRKQALEYWQNNSAFKLDLI